MANSLSLQGPGYSGKTGHIRELSSVLTPMGSGSLAGWWHTIQPVYIHFSPLPVSSEFSKFFKILAHCDCYASR